MKRTAPYLLIVVLVLSLAALACGSSSNGKKVDTQTGPTTTPGVETFAVGDVIEVREHTIVLNEYTIDGTGRLTANFTVENKGTDEKTISNVLLFSAKNADGETLEQDTIGCSPELRGKVLSGDKLKGNVCWEGMNTPTGRIYYTANAFSSGAVVWEVSK